MSETKSQYAFVTLFMYNERYIYGSLAMAHSLRLTKTEHNIVCMITPDLYEKYVDILKLVYDDVCKVPYYKYTSGKLVSKKQREIYSDWQNISYTKWNCLGLNYKKICFLDSDLVIVKNIDHLFNIAAPAACFVNSWVEKFKGDQYKKYKFGDIISDKDVKVGLNSTYTLVGHCVILEPSNMETYDKFMNESFIGGSPCLSMVDERAIAQYQLYLGNSWTQLSYQYNTIPWKMSETNIKPGKLRTMLTPYILHYFNKIKPWMMNRGEWVDIEIWWQIWDSFIKSNETKEIMISTHIAELTGPKQTGCAYCTCVNKFTNLNYDTDHELLSDTIICNKLII